MSRKKIVMRLCGDMGDDSMGFAETEKWMFMDTVERQLGRWYIYGGDDPLGFDCSGVIVEALKTVGRLKNYEDLTADGLWHRFRALHKEKQARRGALVFWFDKSGRAAHVGVCRTSWHYIAAEGGGEHVKTMEDAIKFNAFIKMRPLTERPGAQFLYLWED